MYKDTFVDSSFENDYFDFYNVVDNKFSLNMNLQKTEQIFLRMGKLQNLYDENDLTLYTTIETIKESTLPLVDNILIKLVFKLDDR